MSQRSRSFALPSAIALALGGALFVLWVAIGLVDYSACSTYFIHRYAAVAAVNDASDRRARRIVCGIVGITGPLGLPAMAVVVW